MDVGGWNVKRWGGAIGEDCVNAARASVLGGNLFASVHGRRDPPLDVLAPETAQRERRPQKLDDNVALCRIETSRPLAQANHPCHVFPSGSRDLDLLQIIY